MTHADRGLGEDDLRNLRLLDPARAARPEAGRSHAAQALLGRILEGSLEESTPGPVTDDRRRWTRWVVAGAAAAAVALGAVLLPPWGGNDHAFASWTPAPEEVSSAVLAEVAEKCSNELAVEMLAQDVVIAEERGGVTFGVLARSGHVSHCLLVDGVAFLSGYGATGSSPGRDADLAPGEVQTVLVAGGGSGGEDYTTITGRVGRDVVGVEIHARGGLEEPGVLPGGKLPESITATVENGFYGAWWPGVGAEDIVLTVRLADGTVLSEVPAF